MRRRKQPIPKKNNKNTPVCVGGVAINKNIAYDLYKEFGVPVYYGQDINDADAVLTKALNKAVIQVPVVNNVEEISLPPNITNGLNLPKMKVFIVPITDIVVDNNARAGCSSCDGDKKKNCPLEIGYARCLADPSPEPEEQR